jgi:hypothetical protein
MRDARELPQSPQERISHARCPRVAAIPVGAHLMRDAHELPQYPVGAHHLRDPRELPQSPAGAHRMRDNRELPQAP